MPSETSVSKVAAARRVALLTGVFFGLLLTAPPAAPAARTLLHWPTQIHAFAQDGRFLSWIARAPNTWSPRCGRTYIRSLATGRQRSFGTREAPVCGGLLALSRGRALWTADPGICGNCFAARVFTAALADRRVVGLGTFIYLLGGSQVTGLAGDWNVLAYSWVGYRQRDVPDCLNEPVPCVWDVTGGQARRVVGRSQDPVPGVAPPALLAAGAERIALAPSADSWESTDEVPPPAENGPVEVRDPLTGALIMSVSPTGTVRALALSAGALAVLVERMDASLVVERYAISTGTLLASTPVNANVEFRQLDIAGKWIVYRVGRQIRIIDDLGGDHLLIETPTRPINVSIEGRRVAWAENIRGIHRIRAAFVPD